MSTWCCSSSRLAASPDDAKVLSLIQGCLAGKPVFLIANKFDAVQRCTEMLPRLKSMQERHAFAEFVPLSAKKAADMERLLQIIRPYLPEQGWFYEEDALTDRSERSSPARSSARSCSA